MSTSKKIIFSLFVSLVVICGYFYINREKQSKTAVQPMPKPISAEERKAALKQWEATPAGKMYVSWKESPAGKKVFASEAKIRKSIRENANMEAIVTSLSLPPESRVGFGIMIHMQGEDYILSFGAEKRGDKTFEALHTLKVNDKIILKSRGVSHAPKYAYPIVAGDYVERDHKVIYKSPPRIGGC